MLKDWISNFFEHDDRWDKRIIKIYIEVGDGIITIEATSVIRISKCLDLDSLFVRMKILEIKQL